MRRKVPASWGLKGALRRRAMARPKQGELPQHVAKLGGDASAVRARPLAVEADDALPGVRPATDRRQRSGGQLSWSLADKTRGAGVGRGVARCHS